MRDSGKLDPQTDRRPIAFEEQVIKVAGLQVPEHHAVRLDTHRDAALAVDLFHWLLRLGRMYLGRVLRACQDRSDRQRQNPPQG